MNQKQPKAAVEAMLFAAGDPVRADKLAAAVQLPPPTVETALEELRQPLEDGRLPIARAGQGLTYPAACKQEAARNP